MPKKKPELDWEKFLKHNIEQQDIAEFTKKLNSMCGRELYEMETWSLNNKHLIDRPVNYAFHRTLINYPVEPIDIMRDCLIDGQVFLRVEDATHISIEQYVHRAEWDSFTDILNFIEIKYIYTETNQENYYHIEHYIKNPDGTAEWIIYKPVKGEVPETEWKIDFQMTLPYFPYVGIRWIFNQSFLEPLKASVIRLEAAYRTIGAENIDRLGAMVFFEGVRNVDDVKSGPRLMGRRIGIAPEGSKIHTAGSDPAGIELMLAEVENLQAAIEKASNVVSTEKLASLSGLSRQVAERPLIMLADELRNRFTKGMQRVEELAKPLGGAPVLEISYKPLEEQIPRTLQEQVNLLDSSLEKGYITEEEYTREIRLLLNLGPE